MTHSPILNEADLICQRRRLAMACGCKDIVSDPVTGATGAIECLEVRANVLWARIGDEHTVTWVPAGQVVLPTGRPCTPPPARPSSEPPAIPRQGQLRVTEQTCPGIGRVEVPCEVTGPETVRP